MDNIMVSAKLTPENVAKLATTVKETGLSRSEVTRVLVTHSHLALRPVVVVEPVEMSRE